MDPLETCLPVRGLLGLILIQLNERPAAAARIEHAAALPTGVADGYDALAFVSLQLGLYERSNPLHWRAAQFAPGEARSRASIIV